MTSRFMVALILVLGLTPAHAGTWTVAEGSEVVFTSEAPMESFDGRTQQVSGHVSCSPEDLAGTVDLRVVVDLASLDTGIGLRNRHMRENHLETDEFPEAVFSGGALVSGDPRELRPGAMTRLEVRGIFDLHGVSRELVVPAEITMSADGDLTVEASFEVKLSDHEIKRPKFLVMKLADEQAVTVSLKLTRAETS